MRRSPIPRRRAPEGLAATSVKTSHSGGVRRVSRSLAALIGILIIGGTFIAAVLAPVIVPYPPDVQNLASRLQPPLGFGGSREHVLGTDGLGRDVLSRLVYGTRVSLIVGVSAVALAIATGTFVGLVAGWYGGTLDTIVMRLADLVFAFPFLLLAMLLMALLGAGLRNVIIALSA